MRHSRLRLAAAISLALLAACAAWAESRPRYGGTLAMVTRNPGLSTATPLVFENLTTLDATGKPQAQLATSWESQSGDRRWQFWIRSGVRFHDGTPLTAAAVVASLTAGECETCPWTAARAVGDSVVFEFADPRPQFAAELALPTYRVALGKGTPVGTGPFRQVNPGSPGRLRANDDYWQGRPFLDGVEVVGERGGTLEPDTARADVAELAPEQLRRSQQQRRIAATQPVELIALAVRPVKKPEAATAVRSPSRLDDVRLRRALALSVDRAAVHNFVFQKQGEVAGGLLPNWISGYAFLLPHDRDVPRAQQLRRELGTLAPLVIAAEEKDPALQLIAERIALNARDAGIAVQSGPKEAADLVVVRRPLLSTNPAVALAQMFSYFSAEQLPPAASPQQLYDTERELIARYAFVPLVYLPRAYGLAQRVRNWNAAPDGRLGLQDVWLSQ